MEFFGKIIQLFAYKSSIPQMLGTVHILSFALSIALGVAFCIFFKKADKKTVRILLLVTALISITLEIYKQILFSFSYDGFTVLFDYQWYVFPLQFCSLPMYIGLAAFFIKNEKIHNALCTFLATYGFFAGLVVMIYPAQVYSTTVGLNIQTMVCHGLMVAIAIYLLGSGYVKLTHKNMLSAIILFASIVCVVMILNEVVYYTNILNGEELNMFYISPHFPPTLLVYSTIQAIIPYPFCVLFYIGGFSGAAYIIMLCAMGIKKISDGIKKKTVKANS